MMNMATLKELKIKHPETYQLYMTEIYNPYFSKLEDGVSAHSGYIANERLKAEKQSDKREKKYHKMIDQIEAIQSGIITEQKYKDYDHYNSLQEIENYNFMKNNISII